MTPKGDQVKEYANCPFGYLGNAPTLSSISLNSSNFKAKSFPIIPIKPGANPH